MIDRSYGVIPVWLGGFEPMYLIIQHHAGHWSFPKGHPEPGETSIATARRELLEETNIRDCKIDDQVFFMEKFRIQKEQQIIFREIKYFLGICPDREGMRPQNEITRARWASRGEALDILTFQTAKDIIEQVHNHLRLNDKNQWT